jgi:hypothetical protein
MYSLNAIDMFIERFVAKKIPNGTLYKINNIEYYKYYDGCKFWHKNDMKHRLDGPAVIYENGEMHWYVNNERHRNDGPAVIGLGGFKSYWQNDMRHRIEGPAIIYSSGKEEYWQYGKRIS